VTTCLFKLRLANGTTRWARGSSPARPEELLRKEVSLDRLLSGSAGDVVAAIHAERGNGPPPPDAVVVAPIDTQEVWAAGVTYVRSRDARERESDRDASAYERVYDADRPELFFKAPAWRVRGAGEEIGIRADSTWDVPEPEVVLCLAADLSIAGLTIGNDVSSRSIEGENPLYLPQAKTYDGSCAIGPAVVLTDGRGADRAIRLAVTRGGAVVAEGEASTSQLKRSFEELASYLGRALTFPVGAFLFTGTGIVPPDSFTLEAGDVVRIEIDGLGVLENPVTRVGQPEQPDSRK
jgi:2-dehydro-3-deoxy-D-arabinonate dehydratase